MRMKDNSQVYSVLKAAEGGMAQGYALWLLKKAGIKARRDYSPYVGHYGIRVYGGPRAQRKAEKILL